MAVPNATETPVAFLTPTGPRAALAITFGLLCLAAAFAPEINSATHTWVESTAYNHCFLVVPIVLYLLWDRRADLARVPAMPEPKLALIGVPVALIWLASERLGIMEGRQLAAITLAQVLFLAVLGRSLWQAAAGPLLYLYFLVPVGEFLTPKLQDSTTFFIRHGLDVLGVPAYIDGYIIEIPQGTFFVAQACAGLRFLIASIAFGCLYALLMYRSPVRRAAFILVSIVVPIIANGCRGLGIVYLGHLLGSAQAAAADHLIYGWLFFSLVTLLLIVVGLPFRQDSLPAPVRSLTSGRPTALRSALAGAGIVAAVAAACPILTTALAPSAADPIPALASMNVGPGCTVAPDQPRASAAGPIETRRVICDTIAMDVTWETFSPRVTAGPVMAERRRLTRRAATESLNEAWLDERGGTQSAWRIMQSNDPYYILATSIWIDGTAVRPGLGMRARLALNSLLGTGRGPVLMTVTPAVRFQQLDAAQLQTVESDLKGFLEDHPDLFPRPRALADLSR